MNKYLDFSIRILASFLCALFLGIERKSHQHTVGIRTLVLISVSSCLLSVLSTTVANITVMRGDLFVNMDGDPTRIIAGVVTGIGFLGAGAILRWGINIRGITTAAIIWSTSALGIACGVGEVIFVLICLIFIMATLLIFSKVEHKFYPASKNKILTITYLDEKIDLDLVKKALAKSNLIEHDLNIEKSLADKQTVIRFWVKAPKAFDLDELIKGLSKVGNLAKISINGE